MVEEAGLCAEGVRGPHHEGRRLVGRVLAGERGEAQAADEAGLAELTELADDENAEDQNVEDENAEDENAETRTTLRFRHQDEQPPDESTDETATGDDADKAADDKSSRFGRGSRRALASP